MAQLEHALISIQMRINEIVCPVKVWCQGLEVPNVCAGKLAGMSRMHADLRLSILLLPRGPSLMRSCSCFCLWVLFRDGEWFSAEHSRSNGPFLNMLASAILTCLT